MNPFLTCSSLPHPLHRNAIRSPHRQSYRRRIWAIYAALKPSSLEPPSGTVDLIEAALVTPSVVGPSGAGAGVPRGHPEFLRALRYTTWALTKYNDRILLVKSPQGDKRNRHSVLWLSLTG